MSVARVAIGLSLIVEPRIATAQWIGRSHKTAAGRVLARALGARDMAVGLGTLLGLSRRAVSPWLLAGMLCDTADLVVTIAERDSLPAAAVPVVGAAAGLGVALGAYGLTGTEAAPVPA
jgi:hypothetical protein